MAEKLLLPAKIEDLTPLQKGYLLIAQKRSETSAMLEKDELEIQRILKDITLDQDWESVKNRIKEARDLAEASKQKRLIFTTFIHENIVVKAMEFEKRNTTLITDAGNHEFALRKKAQAEQAEREAHSKELNSFRAHLQNENFRIAAEYRFELEKMASESYATALKQKQPVKEIKAYIEKIEAFMRDIKVGKMQKFELLKLTKEEAKKEFEGVTAYNPAADLEAAIEKMKLLFDNYKADLKNAEAAAEAVEKQLKVEEHKMEEAVEVESASNILIAQAGVVSVTGSAAPKIKVKTVIVEEATEAWAFAVITQFVKHSQSVKQYLKVRTWSNLKVSQMADALGALITEDPEIKLTGLKTTIEEK